MEVVLKLYQGRWVIDLREGHHTHRASIGALVHPSLRRRMQQELILNAIKDAWHRQLSQQNTIDLCRDRWPSVPVTYSDIMNTRARMKRIELGGRTDLQDLLVKIRLDDSDFIPYYTHDAENRLTRLLFFHK